MYQFVLCYLNLTDMHPIICKLGPFTVYSYGLMLALAFITGSFLLIQRAKKEEVAGDTAFNFAFLTFVWGVIGARIFYVIYNLLYYLKNPLEIIMLQYGGLSWFGGLIAGSIAGIFYLRNRKLAAYKMLDLFAPFVALAQAIGRLGCLLNGCCFGKESVFGIYSPAQKAILLPTQIYSSLLLIVIFIVLRILQEKPHKEGQIFFIYLLLYSSKRFFIEFLRADNPAVLWGLTLFQLLSIIVFFFSAVKLILLIQKSK